VDPNVGLWNDRVNPNWRLTFTDVQTGEKQRVPYAFAIQQQGPHVEFALRFQFGFVSCDSVLSAVPQTVDVVSGWEVTFPLPASGVRLCSTVVRPCASEDSSALATVWCIDCPLGICAGFQRVVSGVGMKGVPELSWRGEVAMFAFIAAALWGAYSLVMLPATWQEAAQDIMQSIEDPEARMAFDAVDFDGDGRISRDDVRAFVLDSRLSSNPSDADALFEQMDVTGTGSVDYDTFRAFLRAHADEFEAMDQEMDSPMNSFSMDMGRGVTPGSLPIVPPMPGLAPMPTYHPMPLVGRSQQ